MPRKPGDAIYIKDIDIVWKTACIGVLHSTEYKPIFEELPEYASVSIVKIREVFDDGSMGEIEYIPRTPNSKVRVMRKKHNCKYNPIEDETTYHDVYLGGISIDSNTDLLLLNGKKYKILSVSTYEKCDWITILGLGAGA